MSTHKPWKAMERRVAKAMRGVRLWRPDFGESAPDGESETHVWDTKCYQRFSVIEMFVRCERKYREWAGDRRFVLVLFSREHPRAGDFVLLPLAQYVADQERLAQLEREGK